MLNIYDRMQEPPDGTRVVVEIRPGWTVVYLRDDSAAEQSGAAPFARWRSCDGRITRVRWFTFEEVAEGDIGPDHQVNEAIWVLGAPDFTT